VVDVIKKEYDMKSVFDVYLYYGEDRKNVVSKRVNDVIADSAEDAKVRSGIYADVKKEWDADFLTIIVKQIGEIKVKATPSEVKQVS
jgi:hypothetical protein